MTPSIPCKYVSNYGAADTRRGPGAAYVQGVVVWPAVAEPAALAFHLGEPASVSGICVHARTHVTCASVVTQRCRVGGRIAGASLTSKSIAGWRVARLVGPL